MLSCITQSLAMTPPDGAVRVIASAGSLMLELAVVPDMIQADAAFLADVSAEIGRVRRGSPSLAVVLGRGDTTPTLLDRAIAVDPAFREMRDALAALGAADLEDGLGMMAFVGAAAAAVEIAQQNLAGRIDRELMIPLLQLKNGSIRHALVVYANSVAGGTGAIAGARFARVVADRFHEMTRAVVELCGLQIGSLSFLGLGDRVLPNGAAALVEQLANLLGGGRHRRETAELVLLELPTVDSAGKAIGTDRVLRGVLATTAAAALASAGVRERLLVSRSNRALGGPYGRVLFVRADWYGTLSRAEVVGGAAKRFAGALSHVLAEQSSALPDLDVVYAVTREPAKTPDRLMSEIRSTGWRPPATFEADALAAVEYVAEIRIASAPVDQFVEEAADRLTREGLTHALAALNGIVGALRQQRSSVAASVPPSERALNRARARLSAAIRSRFPEGGGARFMATFIGHKKLNDSLGVALKMYRAAADQHARTSARARALDAALSRAEGARERTRAVISRLHALLSDLATPTRAEYFSYRPSIEIEAEMMRAFLRGDIGLLKSLLARSAVELTAAGLQLLVRAHEPTPAAIAAGLLGRAQYRGPWWGGAEPARSPFMQVVVVPPLSAQLMSSLVQAAAEGGFGQDVVAADSLSGGASVVRIEAYEAASASDIFTPPYLAGLRDVLGPRRVFYPLSPAARELAESILTSQEAVCASC